MNQELMIKNITEVNLKDSNWPDKLKHEDELKTSLGLLSSLFSASLEPGETKLICMTLDKKKKFIKLKFKKNKQKSGSVYTEDKKNKRGFVLLYKINSSNREELSKELPGLITQNLSLIPENLIPNKLPISIIKTPDSLLIYTEIFYNQESETAVYEEKFDPLNENRELNEKEEEYTDERRLAKSTDYKPDLEFFNPMGEKLTIYEKPKLFVVEYEDPLKTSNLDIYEEIFLRNARPNITVKDLLPLIGLEYEVVHTGEFGGSDYITLLDNKKDGEERRYWEVLVNGQYAENSIDKQQLDEEDVVTFRLAENRAGCGGSYRDELVDLKMLMDKEQKLYSMKNNSSVIPWYMMS
jgi:hypothetical protein